MITRIELKNFMSHEHTVIEPARGLTVISGPNNCGKSAIVTALQILCYNDDSTFVTRHGEKECSIKVTTHDGHEIEWQRTKNKSTKYIIDGVQHDRLGRGGTPDELYEILKIQRVDCDNKDFDVHFGAQKQPVFLLNDSPRAAAQFFASSSDATNLITMQTLHKQKVRDSKSNKKRLVGELARTEQRLETLEPIPEVLDELKLVETQYKKIVSNDEEIVAIHIQVMAIETHTKQQQELATLTESLDRLTPPPVLPSVKPLETLVEQLQQNHSNALMAGAFADVLEELRPCLTPVSTGELSELIESLQSCLDVGAFAEQAAESLADIAQPPELLPEEPLRDLVASLEQKQQRVSSLAALLDATTQIASPPVPADFSELDQLVQELNRQSQQVDKIEEQAVEVTDAIQQVKVLIENWVANNPACPTCGGDLTAEQVINPNGAHRHD